MGKKHYKVEEIIGKLREVEVLLSQGETQESAVRKIGVSKNTYWRWQQEYGGLKVNQAKRLKELETENQRLKKIVANQAMDIDILQVAVKGKY